MSLIGKFFVVMQILLSVTFMGFAVAVFTYQTDWKAKADTEQQAKQQAQAEVQNLQTEFDKYKTDTTTALQEAQDVAERTEAANTALQRQLEDRNREYERIANDLQSQTTLAEVTENEASARVAEAMAQRTVNTELHAKLKEAKDQLRNAEDEIHGLGVEKDNLIVRNRQLTEELGFLRKVVRNNNLETDPRVYAAQNDPPPILEGMVINAAENAKGSVDLVEISLGSDDGLVKGHKLFVFRSGLQSDEDAKYLGQIELVFVDSDHAVGTVIEKAKSGIIKKGDNVTSKL
ncbi:hypothetical protein [Rubinisphaera sp. JC750]|uniref:hypothetical protein n=1 Tax=Rubinisphaera sp. JC750 TaxID=2898658 RepID=UPI001F38EAFE|nr:hypothetical protein [Rubinisphaera sp. JC750]